VSGSIGIGGVVGSGGEWRVVRREGEDVSD